MIQFLPKEKQYFFLQHFILNKCFYIYDLFRVILLFFAIFELEHYQNSKNLILYFYSSSYI